MSTCSCIRERCTWHFVQELNGRGTHLLFRDKAQQLHLFDLASQQRSSMLSCCQYVQWVPGSDVVVAQSRSNLCVWYSISNPDRYAPQTHCARPAATTNYQQSVTHLLKLMQERIYALSVASTVCERHSNRTARSLQHYSAAGSGRDAIMGQAAQL